MRPPFPYFGGKQTLADRLVALMPSHGHYVEPFAGSLSVLLAKPPSTMETVNDLDGDLVHFWRILRDRPDELIRVCALTPHSRSEHVGSYDRATCPDIERARRVWVCLTQGRGATLRATGFRHYVRPSGSTSMPDYLAAYVSRMEAVVQRLSAVTLECQPAMEIISRYGDEPEVLLYIDPPYLAASRATPENERGRTGRYATEMLDEPEHRKLIDQLLACRASIVLSGYASPLYDDALAAWDRVEFQAGTGQSARGEWSTRTEVVWSNREISQPSLFDAEPARG